MQNDDAMRFRQLETEVLEEVHRAEGVYFDATGPEKAVARLRFVRALERLTAMETHPTSDACPRG